MIVKSNERVSNISENYSTGLRYQFLDDNYIGIHPAVFCKDFLTDVVWSEKTKKKVNIYGFRYSPGTYQFKEKFKIALDYSSQQKLTEKDCSNIETVINYVESCMNIPYTKAQLTDDGKFIVVEADSEWLSKPYMVSFYTLLLRYSFKYNGGEVKEFITNPKASSNDVMYLRQAKPLVSLLLENNPPDQKFEDYGNSNAIHENSGVSYYSQNVLENENIPA